MQNAVTTALFRGKFENLSCHYFAIKSSMVISSLFAINNGKHNIDLEKTSSYRGYLKYFFRNLKY